MKSKTIKSLLTMNLALVALLTGGILLNLDGFQTLVFNDSNALGENYTLNFTSNQNKLTFSENFLSGENKIRTSLGNEVSFTYHNVSSSNSYWQVIDEGGYIQNASKISGIKSIEIVSNSGIRQFQIHYSKFANFSEYEILTFSYSDEYTSGTYAYNFTDMNPNYIRIVNISSDSDLYIDSVSITYTCSDLYIGEADHPKVGKTYNFGYYPQTRVVDDSFLIDELNSVYDNSLNMYLKVGNYIAYAGDLYLPVEEGAYSDRQYYKVEPVEWKVLAQRETGEYEFISNKVIDAKTYDSDSSNYANSDVRNFLNNEMYNTLFNNFDKTIVESNKTDNGSDTTRSIYIGKDPNPHAPAAGAPDEFTDDYVYLLSYRNFDGTHGYPDLNTRLGRATVATDYSHSNGYYYQDENSYWTRSPSNNSNGTDHVSYIESSGSGSSQGSMLNAGMDITTVLGLRVGITFNLTNSLD